MAPDEAPGAVQGLRRAKGGEDEAGKARVQRRHRRIHGGMAGRGGVRVDEQSVLRPEFGDRRAAACRIGLAEYLVQVAGQQGRDVVGHGKLLRRLHSPPVTLRGAAGTAIRHCRARNTRSQARAATACAGFETS
jgi:hypothetical protein